MDAFDSIVNLDADAYQRGYAEGQIDGARAGTKEGMGEGYKAGFQEIGYYLGCIEACLIYSEKYPDLFSERVLKSMRLLHNSLRELKNAGPEAMNSQRDSLYFKFKSLQQQSGLDFRIDAIFDAVNPPEVPMENGVALRTRVDLSF